jgi:hypothetical protein
MGSEVSGDESARRMPPLFSEVRILGFGSTRGCDGAATNEEEQLVFVSVFVVEQIVFADLVDRNTHVATLLGKLTARQRPTPVEVATKLSIFGCISPNAILKSAHFFSCGVRADRWLKRRSVCRLRQTPQIGTHRHSQKRNFNSMPREDLN